jgi:UDP-N-acetylglucosamine 2-epimerase (non-hydrolysing)
MQRILHVVGARPNFMKMAPIMQEMAKYPNEFEQTLVHTGQHYDEAMSRVFFDELELPLPDINLDVGSGSHAWQTARVMQSFEPVLTKYAPDCVLVPGDVNSTVACALVAAKLGVRVGHVEAGLRSFDRTMPEELNRIVTDHLSDILFTTEPSGNENLSREGIADEKVYFVGNTMIDTLVRLLPKAEERWRERLTQRTPERFILVTLHRPSNVDDADTLQAIITALKEVGREIPVVFPVHPRTRERLARLGLPGSEAGAKHIQLLEPLGYLDFLALQAHAALVLTDSGGVQEETTYLGVPCLTTRPNTERPVTITVGTNRLVGNRVEELIDAVMEGLDPAYLRIRRIPERWDGQAARRIVEVLQNHGKSRNH